MLKVRDPHVTEDTVLLQLRTKCSMLQQCVPSLPSLQEERSLHKWLILPRRVIGFRGWRQLLTRGGPQFNLSFWALSETRPSETVASSRLNVVLQVLPLGKFPATQLAVWKTACGMSRWIKGLCLAYRDAASLWMVQATVYP